MHIVYLFINSYSLINFLYLLELYYLVPFVVLIQRSMFGEGGGVVPV
jgi:hypothetical protein